MITPIALLAPLFITAFWSLVFCIQWGKIDVPKLQLGFFMLLGFLLYFTHAIFFSRHYQLYVALEFVYLFSMLALYPAYFIYLKLLINKPVTARERLLHFLPGIMFACLALLTTLLLLPEERITYARELLAKQNLKGLEFRTRIELKAGVLLAARIALLFQVLYYAVRGIRLINGHNQEIADYYSDTEGRTVNWARTINIAIVVVAITSASLVFIGRSYFVHHEFVLLVPSTIMSMVLFVIGLRGNQQFHAVWSPENPEAAPSHADSPNGQQQKLKAELMRLIEVEKIYTIPDLRIVDVSERLGTNRTYISKLINEEFQMNFNEFINHFRVEAARELLENPAFVLYKLDVISRKSGFSNMNSFTRNFKSFFGTTPGNYRKQFL